MWVTTLWDYGLAPLQWGAVVLAAAVAAVCDIQRHRIPNRLTGPVLLAGVLWALWRAGPAGVADSALACVMLAFPYVLLFVLARGGAGDAKLMGAIGAWLGIVNGMFVLVAVSLAAIVMGLGFAMAKRQLQVTLHRLTWMALCLLRPVLPGSGQGRPVTMPDASQMQRMPYGVAIFAGVCLAAGAVFTWRGR